MTLPSSPAAEAAPLGPWAALASAARSLLGGIRARLARRGGHDGGLTMAQNGGGGRDGPPDLDELWRDFNKKLSGLFGGKGGGQRRGNGSDPEGGPNFQPNMRIASVGAALIGGVILVIWLVKRK